MITLVLLALTAAQAGVAAPVARPLNGFALALETDALWRLDGSYRAFQAGRHDGALGASLAYDLARVGRSVVVAAWAGVRHEGNARTLFTEADAAALRATFAATTVSAGALLRLEALSWLQPHLRVGVDGTFADVELRAADGLRLGDDAFLPGVSAGAGFRLRTPVRSLAVPGRPAFALAAGLEGGFAAGLPFAVEPEDLSGGEDRLPASAPALGTLGRAHPYLRFTLALLY